MQPNFYDTILQTQKLIILLSGINPSGSDVFGVALSETLLEREQRQV